MTLNLNLCRNNADYRRMNGLSLAYIGDAVYELLVRQMLMNGTELTVKDFHSAGVRYVNAAFQADAMERLLPMLTEEEELYYKRGRNAKSAHTPKNKTEAQYHRATGFEALFGYLYLKNDRDRMDELFRVIMEEGNIIENENQ